MRTLALSILLPLSTLGTHPAAAQGTQAETATPAAPPLTDGDSSGAAARPQGNFTIQRIPVNHWTTAEMKKFLAPLVSPGGAVLDQPGEKTLMIVDTPANFQRLRELEELVDDPALAAARVDVFQPKGASADELASSNELIRTHLAAATPPSFVELLPLPRSNRLLVLSRNEEAWNIARQWLERIDASVGVQRRIFVYPIEESKIDELKDQLNRPRPPGQEQTAIESLRQGRAVLRMDSVTNSLVVYGTAQEFQEIKNAVGLDRQMDDFKERLSASKRNLRAVAQDNSRGK